MTLRGVSKWFETEPRTVALQRIDLEVCAGEFLVVVGPSGCGKTTLLRIIAELEAPSSGEISFHGTESDGWQNAMVFQGRSVFPWLSVRRNVGYGLRLQGRPAAERRVIVDEMLSIVGLTRFADAYPHQLSEGMRQRVAFARALAVDPHLLLMDEPFGALDEQTRFILQDEVVRIWERRRNTVVMVTHSIDEALTLADRVVVMTAHPGRIKTIVPVPFERPRRLDAVREDPRYPLLFRQIWEALREEVVQARIGAGEIVR